jgi:hypothetical protein
MELMQLEARAYAHLGVQGYSQAALEIPLDEWEDFLRYIVEGKDVTLHPQAHPEQRLYNLPAENIEARPEFCGIGAEM